MINSLQQNHEKLGNSFLCVCFIDWSQTSATHYNKPLAQIRQLIRGHFEHEACALLGSGVHCILLSAPTKQNEIDIQVPGGPIEVALQEIKRLVLRFGTMTKGAKNKEPLLWQADAHYVLAETMQHERLRNQLKDATICKDSEHLESLQFTSVNRESKGALAEGIKRKQE